MLHLVKLGRYLAVRAQPPLQARGAIIEATKQIGLEVRGGGVSIGIATRAIRAVGGMLGLVLVLLLTLAGVGLVVLIRLMSRLGVDVASWMLVLLLLLGLGSWVVLTRSWGLMLLVVLGLVILGRGDVTVPGSLLILLLLLRRGGSIGIVVVVVGLVMLILNREVITVVVVTHRWSTWV